MRAEHKELGLEYRCVPERKVDCHLVAVEVCVECGTCKRMQLDGLSFYHFRLECLDTETVQGRGTVQQYRMSLHYVLEDVPDDRVFPVYYLLGRLDGLYNSPFNQFPDDERFVQLGSHELRKTALVHPELGTNHDDRTGGIVHSLAEEVLTEAALFSFKAV